MSIAAKLRSLNLTVGTVIAAESVKASAGDPTLPGGVLAGDFAAIFWTSNNSTQVVDQAGWTTLYHTDIGSTDYAGCSYKWLTGSEGNTTVSLGGTASSWSGVLIVIRTDVQETLPPYSLVDGQVDSPSLEALSSKDFYIGAVHSYNEGGPTTAPVTLDVFDAQNWEGGEGVHIGGMVAAAAGPTGAQTFGGVSTSWAAGAALLLVGEDVVLVPRIGTLKTDVATAGSAPRVGTAKLDVAAAGAEPRIGTIKADIIAAGAEPRVGTIKLDILREF